MNILFTITIVIITFLITFCYCETTLEVNKSTAQNPDVTPPSNCPSGGVGKRRVRRQTIVRNIARGDSSSVIGTIGLRGPFINNNRHILTGQGTISKQFNPGLPFVYKAGLDYKFPRGNAALDFKHTHGKPGGDFSGRLNHRILTSRDGLKTLDGNVNFKQSIGRQPQIGAGLTGRIRFDNRQRRRRRN